MTQLSLTDLYMKNGKLNNAILRRDWFKSSDLYKEILNLGVLFGADPESITELIFLYKTKIQRPNCEFCSQLARFNSKTDSYRDHCGSRSCSSKSCAPKRTITNIELYGVKVSPNVINGARQRSSQLNIKGRQTLLDRYGIINPGQMSNHLNKVRSTLLENWGVNHQSKISHVITTRSETSIEFYQSLSSVVEVKSVFYDDQKLKRYSSPCSSIEFVCKEHGSEILPSETFKWRSKRFDTPCSTCLRPQGTGSIAQLQLSNWIESLGLKIGVEDRTLIDPYELDIIIPELKIAIEYDGLYWHSTTDTKPDNRHLDKLEKVEAIGWTLIRVLEDDWNLKRDLVKSLLKSKFGLSTKICARECVIDESIDEKESQKFLDENHLLGFCNSNKRVGLRKDGILVALLTISQRLNESEITRICFLVDHTIVNGISKLLSGLDGLTVYVDRRYSNGCEYLEADFKLSKVISPNFEFTDLTTRFNKLLKIDSELTEHENMLMNKYRKVWDCGQFKLTLNRSVHFK